jgi:hypothetical protein
VGEPVVERDDALSIGVLGDPGARVARGDGRLQRVRPQGAAAALRALEREDPAADEQPVQRERS